MTRARGVVCVAATLALLAWWAAAGAQDGPARDRESAGRIFREGRHAWFVSSLWSTSTYEYSVLCEIYFKGDVLEAAVETGQAANGPTMRRVRAARIEAMDDGKKEEVFLQASLDRQLRTLRAGEGAGLDLLLGYLAHEGEDVAGFLMVELSALEDAMGDLRLHLPAGLLTLVGEPGGDPVPSPSLDVLLPRLGDVDRGFVEGLPMVRLELAPLARGRDGGGDEATTLGFEGGLYRFGKRTRWGLAYSGNVSTDEELAFNDIHACFEGEFNLRDRGYLPLVYSLGAEADQSFDVVNAVLSLRLGYVLPVTLNFSPRDGGHIPGTGPYVEFRAEGGERISRSGDDAAATATPEDFWRAGYAVRWKIPLARNTVLRLRHAGMWVFAGHDDGEEFHSLWDVAVETRLGNITYYIGYQEGEAAPLYVPVETTEAGLVVHFR